jgi:histidine triad (HIT) family protein
MDDCLFCKIVKGEIPCVKVFEDDNALAFLDIHPNNPGHTLVIPKQHCRNILDITEETLSHLTPAIKKVSHAVYEGMEAVGLNISINNEEPAGQIIFHSHIHIIPRFKNDKLRGWTRNVGYKDGEMEEVAEKIKKALE